MTQIPKLTDLECKTLGLQLADYIEGAMGFLFASFVHSVYAISLHKNVGPESFNNLPRDP